MCTLLPPDWAVPPPDWLVLGMFSGIPLCFRGLECSSSPTSGTCFCWSGGLWPSDCAQISFFVGPSHRKSAPGAAVTFQDALCLSTTLGTVCPQYLRWQLVLGP